MVLVPLNDGVVLLVGEQEGALEETLMGHGYNVLRVESAAACLRVVQHRVPAVIVVDRALPDDDGWELIRKIRSPGARLKNIKVIALTSDTSRGSVERALMAGCDAFLGKPCSPLVLLEEMRRLLALPTR